MPISNHLEEFKKYYKNKKVLVDYRDELVYSFNDSNLAYREMIEANFLIDKLNLPLTAIKTSNSCYFTIKSNEYE